MPPFLNTFHENKLLRMRYIDAGQSRGVKQGHVTRLATKGALCIHFVELIYYVNLLQPITTRLSFDSQGLDLSARVQYAYLSGKLFETPCIEIGVENRTKFPLFLTTDMFKSTILLISRRIFVTISRFLYSKDIILHKITENRFCIL